MSKFSAVENAILRVNATLARDEFRNFALRIELSEKDWCEFKRDIPSCHLSVVSLGGSREIEFYGAIIAEKGDKPPDARRRTSGKWTHYETSDGQQVVCRGGSGGFVVMDENWERAKADAALIAAAPNLLFALSLAQKQPGLPEPVSEVIDAALALAGVR